MTKKMIATGMMVLGFLSASLLLAQDAAQSVESTARKILNDYQDAIVWMNGTIKQGEQNTSIQLTGTVVDESGIIVCSLRAIQPFMMIVNNELKPAGSDADNFKVLTPDGKEVPAKLIMKDDDWDIAVIQIQTDSPEAKDIKWKAIDLKKSSDIAILDKIIEMTRMDASGNRQPYIRIGSVVSLTTKPKKFFFTDGGNLSCPVFAANGNVVGMAFSRSCKDNQGRIVMSRIVLPAADIQKVVDQAKKNKKEPVATAEEKKIDKADVEKKTDK